MTNDDARYAGFIRDSVYLLREEASKVRGDSDFERGREFGLRQALAWLQHEAIAFGLDRGPLLLEGFDAMTGKVAPPPPKPRS